MLNVCPSFQRLIDMTDLHEIWFGRYANTDYLKLLLY
jgi:hypothetical protein